MKRLILFSGVLIIIALAFYGCSNNSVNNNPYLDSNKENIETKPEVVEAINTINENVETEVNTEPMIEVATFAGGCFWCVESDFEKLTGVKEVISGFSGGEKSNPTYGEVAAGRTRHIESVQVYYYSDVVLYNDLLEHFFKHIDPTDDKGSFVDRGYQYSSAVFYHNDDQKFLAEEAVKELGESGVFDKPIVTQIAKFKTFYEAEDYHQDYYKKSSVKYNFYRSRSGRDSFVNNAWEGNDDKYDLDPANTKQDLEDDKKDVEAAEEVLLSKKIYSKPSDEEIKNILTDLQYKVTQKEGTEEAFANEYWDNKEDGIYVDIVSGEPLFSSVDKYKSGTGWPSFTRPLESENIVEKVDKKLFTTRTEIRSKYGDSHVGHVFDDGPVEEGGLRYCMNSAALRFIPKDKLTEEGYDEYLELFE